MVAFAFDELTVCVPLRRWHLLLLLLLLAFQIILL